MYDRQGKDLFVENVVTSLGRFYTNLYKQIDLFYMTYAKTFTIASFDIINKYNNVVESKISEVKDVYLLNKVDYHLFDLSFMNFDSDITNLNSLQETIKHNFESFNRLNKEYNLKDVSEREDKKNLIKEDYKQRIANVRSNHKNSKAKIEAELAKKIDAIKKEYKLKLIDIKKSTRNRISNAEKLLKESKKYLA